MANRVNGMLAVSRSFGDVPHKGSGSEASTVVATPELQIEDIADKDEFIVLATDGLWDVMPSQHVVNFVRLSLHEHKNIERAARDVANEAIRQGSVDNVSVVIVAFHQIGKALIDDDDDGDDATVSA